MMIKFWYFLCTNFLKYIPDAAFVRLMVFINFLRIGYKPYWLNLKEPRTFNEKLNWLKLNKNYENKFFLADKYLVREYVKNTIGEQYLIELIGVFNNAEEINIEKLPNSFALKTNHGSGWNFICQNKHDAQIKKKIEKLNYWLGINAYFLSRERQYKNIKPLLICEHLLGYNIQDYKIFCANGQPFMIQVDDSRFTHHKRTLFDLKWNRIDIGIRYEIIDKEIERPIALDEMLLLSKKLSQLLDFCRVDLYYHEGRIYFGEITFHPGGGMEPFHSYEDDLKMGEYISIPNLQ